LSAQHRNGNGGETKKAKTSACTPLATIVRFSASDTGFRGLLQRLPAVHALCIAGR